MDDDSIVVQIDEELLFRRRLNNLFNELLTDNRNVEADIRDGYLVGIYDSNGRPVRVNRDRSLDHRVEEPMGQVLEFKRR